MLIDYLKYTSETSFTSQAHEYIWTEPEWKLAYNDGVAEREVGKWLLLHLLIQLFYLLGMLTKTLDTMRWKDKKSM